MVLLGAVIWYAKVLLCIRYGLGYAALCSYMVCKGGPLHKMWF